MADPTVEVVEKTEQPSFLGMSDADMLNAVPPTVEVKVEAPVASAPVETVQETTPVAEVAGETEEAPAGEEGGTPTEPVVADEGEQAADATAAPKEDKVPKEPVVEAKDDKPKEVAAIDYEAEYKRLLSPFKANGREIQVESVEDAVALMQMGANYNKKMAALKPNLKLMKMLENNGFLSEDKIGFLIDLGKKDPAAISKLVKDSGVDPMDLDAEKASTYKQTAYAVDDREIELDTVLDEIQGSPTYTRTLDVVSNKWDVASKQVVSQTPQLLKVINGHMANGMYDLISTEIERNRMLGRLSGLSDIEAYRQVGDAINARGGFNHLVQVQGKTEPKVPEIVPPKAKVVEDDKLKDKRRAASSTKTAAPSVAAKDFNPLALSDEEFSKLTIPKFA